jgi:ubiquinone/menaquinone biosynthesis C-methylase UbiE
MQLKDNPMADQPIRFDDGAAYERMMGVWSRLAGEVFLDWLAPRPGFKWIDVGCGNGAFTELIVAKHAPAEIKGVDPSDGQLAYARTRRGTEMAEFHKGDAMALPFGDRVFDVAIMALVIFFVPEPAKGVAEMVRVVAPGGPVAA